MCPRGVGARGEGEGRASLKLWRLFWIKSKRVPRMPRSPPVPPAALAEIGELTKLKWHRSW